MNESSLLVGGQDSLLHVLPIDLSSGSIQPSGAAPASHDHWVTAVLSDASTIVSGCYDGKIRLFEASSGEKIGTLEGHTKGVVSLCWAGAGQVL